jgi:hypothetical protein
MLHALVDKQQIPILAFGLMSMWIEPMIFWTWDKQAC